HADSDPARKYGGTTVAGYHHWPDRAQHGDLLIHPWHHGTTVAGIGRHQGAHHSAGGNASRAEYVACCQPTGGRLQNPESGRVGSGPEPHSESDRRLGRKNSAGGGSWEAASGNGRAGRKVFRVVDGFPAGKVCIHSSASAGDHLSHGELSAWRMAAPDRQHVVSVAGGICAGRRLGPAPVYRFLSGRRCSRLAILCLDQSRQHHSLRWSIGRNRGVNGCISNPLPQDEDRDDVDTGFFPHLPFSSIGVLVVAPVGHDGNLLWFAVRQDEWSRPLG